MNRSLILLSIAGALAFGSSVPLAVGQTTAPHATEGTPAPTLTPAEREKMKAEAAEKKAARGKMTAEQKRAADAQRQKDLDETLKSCEGERHMSDLTPEQAAKLKADAAAAKAARAKMTAADRKALGAEKQKQLQECIKAGG